MKTPTLGLAGAGLWGRNVLRDLLSLGASVLVAEPSEHRRDEALAAGAAGACASVAELSPVDGFIVATPASTHAAVLEEVLPLGVPVFVEKPFTTDVPSARRFAREAPDRLFVMHNWRYHPGILSLAGIAASGELGPVLGLKTTRTNWTSPRTDVDSTWTLVPHDLSIAIALLGRIPEPRCAVAEIHDGNAVGMTGVLGDAPWFVFDASNRHRDKRREVRLHGRDGVAVLPDADCGFVEIARGREADPVMETRPVPARSALLCELDIFLRHLDGGPPPPTTAAEGLLVVEGVVALRRLAGLEP